MQLQRIRIQNFRSLDDVEFHTPSPVALVGENNSGKTNILEAIYWLLTEDAWPLSRRLEPIDFHLNRVEIPIRICAWFDVDAEETSYFGRSHRNNLLQARWQPGRGGQPQLGIGLSRTLRGSENDWFAFVDHNGDPIQYGRQSAPLLRRISSEDHEWFDAVLIGARREASRTFGGQSWTAWSRLLRDLVLSVPAADRAEIDEKLAQAAREAKPLVVADLERDLNAEISRILPVKAAITDIELSPMSLEDAFRAAQLYVSDPLRTSLDAKGMALQSAATMGLYLVKSQLRPSCVLLIEEPELFLHPHNQRLLLRELARRAESASGLLYSSHSPALIPLGQPDHVLLARRPETATDLSQISGTRLDELKAEGLNVSKLARPFDASRNELFFARSVLLVEGEADRQAVHAVLSADGIEPDALGISVIDVGGDGNVADYALLCRELAVPTICLLDKRGNEGAQRKAEAACDRIFWMEPDLELAFLDSSSLTEEFVVANIGEALVSQAAESIVRDHAMELNDARREALRRLLKRAVGVSWPSDVVSAIVEEGTLPHALRAAVDAALAIGQPSPTAAAADSEEELPF